MQKKYYKISELEQTQELHEDDIFEVSTNGSSKSVFAESISENAVLNTEFPDLTTTDKTIIGAINESVQSHVDVEVEPIRTTGTEIATIKVNNNETKSLYVQEITPNTSEAPVDMLKNLEIDGQVYNLQTPPEKPIIYGFHIDSSESNPSACVTYLEDAVGMTPAQMNFSTGVFNYGSWSDTFIIQGIKPCILNPSGQVVCYLNKNDYTKDVDGNTVPLTQIEMDGVDEEHPDGNPEAPFYHCNVMIEFPKMYVKVVPDDGDITSGSVLISQTRIDDDYHDFPYIDINKQHKEHFYFAAYNCSKLTVGSTVYLRSVADGEFACSDTFANQAKYCQNNGTEYHLNTLSEISLIRYLCILLSKSLNSQSMFGYGLTQGGNETINAGFRSGIHNKKGLFYGTNSYSASNYENCVKVFGIENFWGFCSRRISGHIMISGVQKIKLCYGQEDGSTQDNYSVATTASGYSGYITPKASYPAAGFLKACAFDDKCMLPHISGGNATATTYYTDQITRSTSGFRPALHGGGSSGSTSTYRYCGIFYMGLATLSSESASATACISFT